MNKSLLLLAAASLLPAAGAAQPAPQTLSAKLVDEYAACAAYYRIVATDLDRLERTDSAANAQAASETALRHAAGAAAHEPSEQPVDARVQARFNFYIRAIARYMDNTAHNISVFAGPSGQRCKGALEDPDAFRATVETELRRTADNPPGNTRQ
jgi:hypothetical protein